jgi:hypothetical protein
VHRTIEISFSSQSTIGPSVDPLDPRAT